MPCTWCRFRDCVIGAQAQQLITLIIKTLQGQIERERSKAA